jgi:hypothetical protein
MLIDGISLVDNSVIANSHVESGSTFPAGPSAGRMYYLDTLFQSNEPGLYVFNGTGWVTGDITSITAGSGLTGGGLSGNVAMAVDTSVIATRAYTDAATLAATSVLDGGEF